MIGSLCYVSPDRAKVIRQGQKNTAVKRPYFYPQKRVIFLYEAAINRYTFDYHTLTLFCHGN